MPTINKKIAIAGAGLVGSLLSIYLAKRGYSVSVFERRPDIRTHIILSGRSINMALSNRGLRALKDAGLADKMITAAVPMHGRMIHQQNGALNFQAYGTHGQHINSISRNGLNAALLEEAEKRGVDFNFEHRCVDIDFEKTSLTLQHHAAFIHKKFDMIIGADGAFSAVRNAMQTTDRFNFSQQFIEHGYKELRIPADDTGQPLLEKNALHIWPRETFMLIALPNADNTFTCTLFLPFDGDNAFKKLKTAELLKHFFEVNFPDAAWMMPTLAEDFRDNPTGSLVTIRCFPWAYRNVLLIGDAAHGIVPFFGQGMNAAFEDCRVLNDMLNQYDDDWPVALKKFEVVRKPDAEAIADLALDNFVEMRDKVTDEKFIIRKKIEAKLHELFPERWTPLYSMVTFQDNMRYSEAKATGEKQTRIMNEVLDNLKNGDNWETLNFKIIVDKLTE